MERQAIRVEAPDEALAGSLITCCAGLFDSELVVGDGGYEVCVRRAGDPNRLVVDTLDAVERWLAEVGLTGTRVHLGERAYTIYPRLV